MGIVILWFAVVVIVIFVVRVVTVVTVVTILAIFLAQVSRDLKKRERSTVK